MFMRMVIMFIIIMGCSITAGAATINVPVDMTLSEAFAETETNTEDDTINIAAGTYVLTETLIYHGDVSNEYSITIQGAGAGRTIIDGNDSVRIFRIINEAADANITIRNLTIQNGRATVRGGGLQLSASGNITVEDTEITGNRAESVGGAFIYTGVGNIIFKSNIVTNNEAAEMHGGAIVFTMSGLLTATGNYVFGNTAAEYAGLSAVAIHGDGRVFNNIIVENIASIQVGGLAASVGTGTMLIANNTICNNDADAEVAGLWVLTNDSSGVVTLMNNIVWENTSNPLISIDIYLNTNPTGTGAGSVNIYYNNYSAFHVTDAANLNTGSNLHIDPELTDTYHLTFDSDCKDAGSPPLLVEPMVDFDGGERRLGTSIDMGADEYVDARITLDPVTLDFGAIDINTDASPIIVTLTNSGTGDDLTVSSLFLMGMDFPEFELDFTAGSDPCDTAEFIIPSGESRTFAVSFRPGTVGDKTTTLNITSDDPYDTWSEIATTGSGQNPDTDTEDPIEEPVETPVEDPEEPGGSGGGGGGGCFILSIN